MITNPSDLSKLRHSLAHLLAAAVLDLWPGTKRAIGPAIENGFYYDFEFQKPISDADLPKIEKKMREILPSWGNFERKEISPAQARELFKNEPYKLELINEFEESGEKITTYSSCPSSSYKLQATSCFVDLCAGGHVEDVHDIHPGAWKLISIAGAYWRGSEKNQMLTRIYGVAFEKKEDLEKHLKMLAEAEKRDHRKLGKELELFTTSPEVGPGLILWLPKGTIIKDELENLGKETERAYGYERVSTPHIAKGRLYEISGHLPYYASDMFPPMQYENETYYVKPMNCPHMHMIYKFRGRSYRELPLRFAEYGTVYRHEDSGTLMGLLRVRGMTQNDAHIYCTDEQVMTEVSSVMKLHSYYYRLFGITDYHVELALPDFKKKKDKYFDDREAWERSVNILREAAQRAGIHAIEKEGEAAFYGPKFDFTIRSAIGREFGASTNQLDFGSGKRFGLTYNDKDGKEKTIPYILHRAPLGSDERFIGFLIEHYGGAFPLWLSPVQVIVLPVGETHEEYAGGILAQLKKENIRAEMRGGGETLGKRIRNVKMEKIPYFLVVGDNEVKAKQVMLESRDEGQVGAEKIDSLVDKLAKKIAEKK